VDHEDVARSDLALQVRIEKMVYGGEGLARTPEGVLLVPLVLPGEHATVQVQERAKGVRRARLLQVIAPSADRVEPGCPYFTRCGGCQYQHVAYEGQLRLKQAILSECFERIAKIPLPVPISIVSAEPWHYRNRTRLQIQKEHGQFQIGYFEPLSHRLCSIEQCPISSPVVSEAIGALADGLGAACFPDGESEIEFFAADSPRALIATVYSQASAPRGFGDAMRGALPELQSVCWRQARESLDRKPTAPEGTDPLHRQDHSLPAPSRMRQPRRQSPKSTLWGSGFLTYHVGEFHFRIGHDSFFQTNRFLLPNLIEIAMADLQGTRALDLYAGAGLFTIPLARRFEKVAAVEASPESARDLESNIGVVSARARSYCLTAEQFLTAASPGWDAVVVDPPRTGLGKIVLRHLARLRARRLVYVSCDPATLARDSAALLGSGHRIRSIHLIDQFPQTFHIESVVHMERLD